MIIYTSIIALKKKKNFLFLKKIKKNIYLIIFNNLNIYKIK